jgi:Amt family ammonium transporter
MLGDKIPVSVSCGIAPFTDPAAEFAQALARAQVACKAAKDRGRARIEVYLDTDASMIRRHTDAVTLGRLLEVLRGDGLILYAQKIIPLQGQCESVSYELLLRSLDDIERNRAPAALFSAAQRYQMESAIDLWVIEHAIAQASHYSSELRTGEIALGINISAQSIVDETFLERARSWIEQSSLAPRLIVFEITETAAVSSFDKARTFIRELRAMGCRFALDDFGTGVNSLKNLKSLSVDRVKIDGNFVSDLLTNAQSAATVRAIVSLTRELGIATIAEYAESDALVERLRDLGVGYAQGYGVEMPRPLFEVLETLRTQ